MAGSKRKSKNAFGSRYSTSASVQGMGPRGAYKFTPPARSSSASVGAKRPIPKNPAPPRRVNVPSRGGNGGGRMGYNLPFSNGGGVGGGGGGGGFGAAPTAPVAPPKPKVTQENFLAGDESLKIQQAALMKALQDYQAGNTADVANYGRDYTKAVDNLGWRRPVEDDPSTPQNEGMAGAWNWEDQNLASGRAYQSQLNDFAGRGTLQSSLYKDALQNLQRSLEDQLGGMDTAKTEFESGKARELSAFTNENTNARNLARNDAIQRYAALYGSL